LIVHIFLVRVVQCLGAVSRLSDEGELAAQFLVVCLVAAVFPPQNVCPVTRDEVLVRGVWLAYVLIHEEFQHEFIEDWVS